MPRNIELRADLLFDESLMRPQTSNDDVRLDAFDQLRRLCVGFRDQTCFLGSSSRVSFRGSPDAVSRQ
jgi:hypothetical protein